MVSRDPSRSNDDPTRAMPATGVGYNRQPSGVDDVAEMSTTTYSPRDESAGFAVDTTSATGFGSTPQTETSAKDKVTEAADTAKEKAKDAAGTAKEKASEAMSTATHKLDAQRDTVAGKLDNVATTLRDKGEAVPGGEKTTQIAQTTADKIETASTYLRENEVSDMMTDLQSFVRTHPTESLLVAAAAGFLVGRAIRG